MRIFLLIFLFLFSTCYADGKPKNHEKIMEYAFYHLDATGILRQSGNGMVYIEVPDAYIHNLFPFIQEEGFVLPTSLDGPNALGAHISVIYGGEAQNYRIGGVHERNFKVFFKISGCKIVPLNQADYESACVLSIEAPHLDKLRKKYGLPAMKYEYHITIGMKPKAKKAA